MDALEARREPVRPADTGPADPGAKDRAICVSLLLTMTCCDDAVTLHVPVPPAKSARSVVYAIAGHLTASSIDEPVSFEVEGDAHVQIVALAFDSELTALGLRRGFVSPEPCRSCLLLDETAAYSLENALIDQTWREYTGDIAVFEEALLPDRVRCTGCQVLSDTLVDLSDEGLVLSAAQRSPTEVLVSMSSGRLGIVGEGGAVSFGCSIPTPTMIHSAGDLVFSVTTTTGISVFELIMQPGPCPSRGSIRLPGLGPPPNMITGSRDGRELFALTSEGSIHRIVDEVVDARVLSLPDDPTEPTWAVYMGPGKLAAVAATPYLGLVDGAELELVPLRFENIQPTGDSVAFDPKRGVLVGTGSHGIALVTSGSRELLSSGRVRAGVRAIGAREDGFIAIDRNAFLSQHIWGVGECSDLARSLDTIASPSFHARFIGVLRRSFVVPVPMTPNVVMIEPDDSCNSNP